VRTWPERIRAVTAEQVRDAARQWLDNQFWVTGYLVKTTRPEEKPPEEKRT
jgi:zinc protease